MLNVERLLKRKLIGFTALSAGTKLIKSLLDLGEKLIKKNIERKIENDMRRTGKQTDLAMFSTFKKRRG